MGVMECNRKGCEHIMCDNYSEVTGYICYDCKRELEDSNPSSISDVEKFMQTTKENKYEDEDGFSLSQMFGEDDDS